MKGLFGIAGLLLALAVTGLLVRQQLRSSGPTAPSVLSNPKDSASALPAKNQPEQYKQALEAAMRTPRPMPDEK